MRLVTYVNLVTYKMLIAEPNYSGGEMSDRRYLGDTNGDEISRLR